MVLPLPLSRFKLRVGGDSTFYVKHLVARFMDTGTEKQKGWKSSDAWLCILALVFFQFALLFGLNSAASSYPAFSHWWAMSFGRGVIYLVQDALWVFVALWFSRVKAVRDFLEPAGLRQGVSLFGWCAAWVAIAIALINGYGGSKGWTAGFSHATHETFSIAWCFFTLAAVLIAPFCEEIATRGFLYRAFRGRYSPLVATIIIIGFSSYFHWNSVSRSVFTFSCLAVGWALLCIVREKTGSLWDCLLCHSVYNAVGSHLWLPTVIAMLVFLPFIAFPILKKRQPKGRGMHEDA